MGQVQQTENDSTPVSAVTTEDQKEKAQKVRTKIVFEIVETEKTYTQALKDLYEKWEKPLRESGIIPETEIRAIFSISEGLHCLHENMCKSLEKRLETWDTETIIGDIFLQNANALKLYTEYVNQYNNGIVLFNKRMKEKNFNQFVTQNGGSLTISSLLIQPVQRIPRYQMLLTDMVKNTWESHDDYRRLKLALGMIIEAAKYVNEQKRRAENLEKLLEIQTVLNAQNSILNQYQFYEACRSIVSEGEIIKQKTDKTKKPHSINYCLMSDKLLLYEKKTGKVYLLADLKEVKIKSTVQDLTLHIYHVKVRLIVEFPTEEARQKWIDTFYQTVEADQRVFNGGLSASLVTEDQVESQFTLRQLSPRGTTNTNIKRLRQTDPGVIDSGETTPRPPPERPVLPSNVPDRIRNSSEAGQPEDSLSTKSAPAHIKHSTSAPPELPPPELPPTSPRDPNPPLPFNKLAPPPSSSFSRANNPPTDAQSTGDKKSDNRYTPPQRIPLPSLVLDKTKASPVPSTLPNQPPPSQPPPSQPPPSQPPPPLSPPPSSPPPVFSPPPSQPPPSQPPPQLPTNDREALLLPDPQKPSVQRNVYKEENVLLNPSQQNRVEPVVSSKKSKKEEKEPLVANKEKKKLCPCTIL